MISLKTLLGTENRRRRRDPLSGYVAAPAPSEVADEVELMIAAPE